MVFLNMQRSSTDIVDVLSFVRVAETGSFARTAERGLCGPFNSSIVRLAREHHFLWVRDFPLFEVPYELPFIAITEAVFTRLSDARVAEAVGMKGIRVEHADDVEAAVQEAMAQEPKPMHVPRVSATDDARSDSEAFEQRFQVPAFDLQANGLPVRQPHVYLSRGGRDGL